MGETRTRPRTPRAEDSPGCAPACPLSPLDPGRSDPASAVAIRVEAEMESIVVGQYRITALSDGMSRLPPMFFPGLDPCQHGAGPDPDGTIHIPTGCFLIQGDGRTILVDAGLGPLSLPFPDGIPTARAVAGGDTPPLSEGGDLPAQLRAAGVESSDVATTLLTHLPRNHTGS